MTAPRLNIITQNGQILFLLLNAEIIEVADGNLAPVIRLTPDDVLNLSVKLASIAMEHGADFEEPEDSK